MIYGHLRCSRGSKPVEKFVSFLTFESLVSCEGHTRTKHTSSTDKWESHSLCTIRAIFGEDWKKIKLNEPGVRKLLRTLDTLHYPQRLKTNEPQWTSLSVPELLTTTPSERTGRVSLTTQSGKGLNWTEPQLGLDSQVDRSVTNLPLGPDLFACIDSRL